MKVGSAEALPLFYISLEAVRADEIRSMPAALLYIVLSAVLGILAVFAGQYVIR